MLRGAALPRGRPSTALPPPAHPLHTLIRRATGRNEMDPPLCGSTAMSHNEFKKIREPIEPQEVSPMKQEMTVLGIDLAKDVDQQDIQALHRVRERLISERTALVNEVHGLMHEYGIVMPKGVSKFRQAVVGKLESEKDKLTPLSQEMFWKLVEEFAALEEQLAYYQKKLEALATTHPECQRLMTIPGIGPLSATALVAAVSDASAFKNGRQCAAWLGLVPRQHSTGGKERLLGISKRGHSSLRKLLVHGARTTLRWVGRKTDRRSQWMRQLVERRGKNRTAVAVANKNARIVWALLTSHQAYELAKG